MLALASVNGQGLPAVIDRQPGRTLEVVSATLSLYPDATFSNVQALRRTTGTTVQQFTDTTRGSYTESGAALRLTTSNGLQYQGTFDSRRLQYLSEGGRSYVFFEAQ